jgi:hypothetical protein
MKAKSGACRRNRKSRSLLSRTKPQRITDADLERLLTLLGNDLAINEVAL